MKGKRGPRDLNKKSVPQLKRVLWDEFSLFIRIRDTDSNGFGNCISCGDPIQLGTTNCQAGHYHPKGNQGSHHLALPRYPGDKDVEMNVNGQCAGCNLMEGGNFINYESGLRDKYGSPETDLLKAEAAKHVIQKRYKGDLIDAIEYYREQVRELEERAA